MTAASLVEPGEAPITFSKSASPGLPLLEEVPPELLGPSASAISPVDMMTPPSIGTSGKVAGRVVKEPMARLAPVEVML